MKDENPYSAKSRRKTLSKGRSTPPGPEFLEDISNVRSWILIIILAFANPLSAMALTGFFPKLPSLPLPFSFHLGIVFLTGGLSGVFLRDDFGHGVRVRALPGIVGNVCSFLAVYFYLVWMTGWRTNFFNIELLLPLGLGCLPAIPVYKFLNKFAST